MTKYQLPDDSSDEEIIHDSGYGSGGRSNDSPLLDQPVDLTKIEDRLPEGTYNFIITRAEAKLSTKGLAMVECTCEVIDGPYEGQNLQEYLSFADGSKGSTQERLAMILGPTVVLDLAPRQYEPLLPNRTFRARTRIDTFNGRRSPKLNGILGPAVGESEKVSHVTAATPAKRNARQALDI